MLPMQVLRTYARAYTNSRLDDVLPVLTRATAQPVDTRFAMPNGLELAAVGRVLVVAGPEDVLADFRGTQATLIVDDLDQCQALLSTVGARIIRGPDNVPTGRNLTAVLADG